MQILDSFRASDFQPQAVIASETFLPLVTRKNRAKLVMIWVQESDGTRQRLIARWVTQD